ncbi:MAG: FHA domain-containing protein [Planctomycetaceae bacterium]|nr:FHA domain-containing protein [Planctomycetaceae bacterium]
MIAELIPLDGSKPISINRDITLVGRKPGLCDVVVDHTSISKVHCALARTDGLLFLRDLGSTNGTRVNGQRVTRGALLPGDELALANVKFRVHLGPGDPGVGHHEQTEAFRLHNTDSRGTIASESNEDHAPAEEFGGADARTLESDSDVRLLPVDSHDHF